MSYFQEVYRKIFKSSSLQKQVLVHELITRDHKFNYYYDIWKESGERSDLLVRVKDGYNKKLSKEAAEVNVHILATPSSNGLAVSYNSSIAKEHFHYLFDWLAHRIETALDYKREVSDRIISEKNDFIEVKEKHYLKPLRVGKPGLTPQLYGNIQIEHITVNDQPSYLKFQANTYTDRQFEKAYNFEDLLTIIFEN